MDTTHNKEIENILQDTDYYNNLQHSSEKLNHINYIRREKELKYSKDSEIKESKIYELPKIHKGKQTITQCDIISESCANIKNLKSRPIIAVP